jgi:hypothetical protein
MKHAIQTIKVLSLFAIISIALSAHSIRANPVFPLKTPVFQASTSNKSTQGSTAKKPKKEKTAKGKKGGGVTFYEGSAESRSERDKRLTRECRGRSNSGLCEGYARP